MILVSIFFDIPSTEPSSADNSYSQLEKQIQLNAASKKIKERKKKVFEYGAFDNKLITEDTIPLLEGGNEDYNIEECNDLVVIDSSMTSWNTLSETNSRSSMLLRILKMGMILSRRR